MTPVQYEVTLVKHGSQPIKVVVAVPHGQMPQSVAEAQDPDWTVTMVRRIG